MTTEKDHTLVPNVFPSIHPEVFSTGNGTLYLKSPGAVLISAPAVNLDGMREFLDGFPEEYKFGEYLNDETEISSVDQLVKTAGQVCYASFGSKRTYNSDIDKYIENIISSGHGSVLEHANFSFLLYGISRSCSHEIVRHRAGTAFSQLSQRYVSGRVLRFVERPEYQGDDKLHDQFLKRIDFLSEVYEETSRYLAEKQEKGDSQILSAESRTDLRKKVQQAARSVLPNETETVMVMTGNIRTWRHVISMRVSEHSEVEIRQAMNNVYKIMKIVAPTMFRDYEEYDLPDGTEAVRTQYPKV